MRFFVPILFAGGLALTACDEPVPTDPQSGLADAGADRAAAAATHRYQIPWKTSLLVRSSRPA
jgi:hypothetical protein